VSATRIAVVIPIKSFTSAKSRLRDFLGDEVSSDLARDLAVAVIDASAPRARIIVCDDDAVERVATNRGAEALRTTSPGLNGALQEAYEHLESRFDVVVIAHADIARPDGLGEFVPIDGVTIVTDRHKLGTNVLALPTGTAYRFAFGDGSAARHEAEAARLLIPFEVITDSPWGLDVDGPEDLAAART
jgi:2-phospho-L-lactate guanylyltransferase